MADQTAIEWCDSTFNPWTGCTKVSPACDHCYAEAWSKRAGDKVGKWGPGAPRVRTTWANWRKPVQWNAKRFMQCRACGWRGEAAAPVIGCGKCGSIELDDTRRRVFCASLADVFDNVVDPAWRADLFALIGATPNLDWLLLTKRIGNVTPMVNEAAKTTLCLNRPFAAALPPNVWLGATICNQPEADRDIPKLLAVPARVRFLSVEPMLGPVELRRWQDCNIPEYGGPGREFVVPTGLHWVICGGESGPGARPMHPDWVRSLRDQCEAAGVPFMFKQHGEWLATAFCDDDAAMIPSRRTVYVNRDGSYSDGSEGIDFFHGAEETAWVGKKAAGRQLDGRTHDGFPEASHA